MRKFAEDEKRTVAMTVKDAFLEVNGKRFHSCYWEALSMEQVLGRLDPDNARRYETRWALTWFVTSKPAGYGATKTMWDFRSWYREGVRQRWRISFPEEYEQRMAHAFVLANGQQKEIIDISSDYTADLLERDLGIHWKHGGDYIWQPMNSLNLDLQAWYVPYDPDRLLDEDSQAPPEGLIDSVVNEAWKRLSALGYGPVSANPAPSGI